jgi:hypothetical protein
MLFSFRAVCASHAFFNVISRLAIAFSFRRRVSISASNSTLRRTLSDLFAITVIGVTAFFSINTAIAVYNNLIKESIVKTIASDIALKSKNASIAVSKTLQTLWNGSLAIGAGLLSLLTRALGLSTVATNLQTAAQTKWNLAMTESPSEVRG